MARGAAGNGGDIDVVDIEGRAVDGSTDALELDSAVSTDGWVKVRVGDGMVDQYSESATAPTRAVLSDKSIVGEGKGSWSGR